MDGKPVGPVLPKRKGMEWSHRRSAAGTGMTLSSFMSACDDHVFAMRATPRGALMVDAEFYWFVHPDAKEGKDYNIDHLTAMWNLTITEDHWVMENQVHGIRGSRFQHRGGQPYARWEGAPAGMNKWYMTEVLPLK